jgi:hypothetical protein
MAIFKGEPLPPRLRRSLVRFLSSFRPVPLQTQFTKRIVIMAPKRKAEAEKAAPVAEEKPAKKAKGETALQRRFRNAVPFPRLSRDF